ncbi:MAG TPA: hypothetical protein VFW09_11685 [Solirubrobacteraceae bacterium]|nr:hypothetical protein [Solirubrobacteraceae bacterium]
MIFAGTSLTIAGSEPDAGAAAVLVPALDVVAPLDFVVAALDLVFDELLLDPQPAASAAHAASAATPNRSLHGLIWPLLFLALRATVPPA